MEMALHMSLKIHFFSFAPMFCGKPWCHEWLPGWIILKLWKQDTTGSEKNQSWYRLLDVVSWWSSHAFENKIFFKTLTEVLWVPLRRPGALCLFCSAFVLLLLFCLFCSACFVLLVLFCLFCSACFVLLVLFCLFCWSFIIN